MRRSSSPHLRRDRSHICAGTVATSAPGPRLCAMGCSALHGARCRSLALTMGTATEAAGPCEYSVACAGHVQPRECLGLPVRCCGRREGCSRASRPCGGCLSPRSNDARAAGLLIAAVCACACASAVQSRAHTRTRACRARTQALPQACASTDASMGLPAQGRTLALDTPVTRTADRNKW